MWNFVFMTGRNGSNDGMFSSNSLKQVSNREYSVDYVACREDYPLEILQNPLLYFFIFGSCVYGDCL